MRRKIEQACALALALAAVIALTGCASRPAPAPEPQPAIAVPAATNAPANEGGITGDEPTIAAPALAAPTFTPTLASALPAPTVAQAEPTTRPTEAPVVTKPPTPAPTATEPPLPTVAPTATQTPAPAAPTAEPPTVTPLPVVTPAPVVSDAMAAVPTATSVVTTTFVPSKDPYPLQIEVMRQQSYPGSEIVIEQTLAPGPNYSRYVVSYRSEGYKIYALMTVPNGPKPPTGWPAIIFNHGYIPARVYRTTERYVAYVDAIARSGYIVFKPDYRGHGSSEGPPEGAYGYPGYTVDVLNAMASVRAYGDADPNRIGMWGHSMGGSLTLRSMVVSKDIKAGAIWGGVVAPYPNLFARDPNRPRRAPRVTATPIPPGGMGPYGRPWRQELTEKYGTPEQNPAFWASISPNSYLADISGPVQLNHSVTDEEVPVASSETLYKQMQEAGKPVELYTYPGDNHNISRNFARAMQRTIAFFDQYVKGAAVGG